MILVYFNIEKPILYVGCMRHAMMDWHTFRQGKGQSGQEYTQEFKKMDLVLGIPLYTQETLLK